MDEDLAVDPETRFCNHKIAPPSEIVRWLALPQSESPIKQRRDVGRLVAMDWGDYPISTDPDEVHERKDNAESNDGSNTAGEKASKTLDKLISNGPTADRPSVFAAHYQDADSLRSGALVGSIGPLPNKELEAPNRESVLMIIGREPMGTESAGEVLDVVPVPPNTQQSSPDGGIVELVTKTADDDAINVVESVLQRGKVNESIENGTDDTAEDSEYDYYVLQAVEFNRDVQWIRYRDYPLFASIRHRGTTNGWNKGSDHLRAAYSIGTRKDLNRLDQFYDRMNSNDESTLKHPSGITWTELRADDKRSDVRGSVALLSDGQLETVANEYLRGGAPDPVGDDRRYTKVHNTYPVGGSLADVDILAAGLDCENEEQVEIGAQVSFETESHLEKVRRLLAWQDGESESKVRQEVWYFGPAAAQEDVTDTELRDDRFVPVDSLFDIFDKSSHLDYSVVENILRVPPSDSIRMPGVS